MRLLYVLEVDNTEGRPHAPAIAVRQISLVMVMVIIVRENNQASCPARSMLPLCAHLHVTEDWRYDRTRRVLVLGPCTSQDCL